MIEMTTAAEIADQKEIKARTLMITQYERQPPSNVVVECPHRFPSFHEPVSVPVLQTNLQRRAGTPPSDQSVLQQKSQQFAESTEANAGDSKKRRAQDAMHASGEAEVGDGSEHSKGQIERMEGISRLNQERASCINVNKVE
jgi:hypothetical protein